MKKLNTSKSAQKNTKQGTHSPMSRGSDSNRLRGQEVKQLSEWRRLSSEPFEDLRNVPSDDGNPMVARNLERIAAHALLLAFLIEKGNDEADAPSILEAQRLLKQHLETLPNLLRDQMEEAQKMLPLGLIQTTVAGGLPNQ